MSTDNTKLAAIKLATYSETQQIKRGHKIPLNNQHHQNLCKFISKEKIIGIFFVRSTSTSLKKICYQKLEEMEVKF